MTLTAHKLFGATGETRPLPAMTASTAGDQTEGYAARMVRSHAERRAPKSTVVPFPTLAPRRSMALAA